MVIGLIKEVGRTDCSNQANRTNRTNQTNLTNLTNLTNPIDYYLLTPIRPISLIRSICLIRPICPISLISLISPICPIILITSIKSISIKQQYYVKIQTYSFKTLRRKPHG